MLIQYFYEGLLPLERQMLDASAGGVFVDKTLVAAKTLIANRALNAQQYEGVGQRDPPRQQEVNAISEIQSQLANLTLLVSQAVEKSKAHEITRIFQQPYAPTQPLNHKEDERLQSVEEEHTIPTARVETPLPQAPIAPKLSIGKSPTPIPIPISTNRLLPSIVQVPNQIKGGRRVHVDVGKRIAKIRKDHYPRPFKESTYEYVVDDIILRDVGPMQA